MAGCLAGDAREGAGEVVQRTEAAQTANPLRGKIVLGQQHFGVVDFDAQNFFVQGAVQAVPEATFQCASGADEVIRDVPHIDALAGKQADEACSLDDDGVRDG